MSDSAVDAFSHPYSSISLPTAVLPLLRSFQLLHHLDSTLPALPVSVAVPLCLFFTSVLFSLFPLQLARLDSLLDRLGTRS